MKDYTTDNPEFSDKVSIVETNDPAHADVINTPIKQIFGNTVANKKAVRETRDNVNRQLSDFKSEISVKQEELSQALTKHKTENIFSETGAHGFRYFDDTFQYYDAIKSKWTDITTGGVAPSNVISPTIKAGNGKLTISWGDPADIVADGQTIAVWKGTKLIQKIGSFPENSRDGILVVDNQTRNQYKDNGFTINNLVNNTVYYFQLFPYSDKKTVNDNPVNRLKAAPVPFRKMTVKIDLNNSNPESCITYHDDAANMSAKSSAWDEFFGHYPCLFKNGNEVGRLRKTDFTKFENGSLADITSGNAGDVMIAFPRRGIKISTSGNIVTVSMTDAPDDPEFKYYAHTRGSQRKDKFYLGAYKGYYDGSKLRSLSGKTPIASQTISAIRTYARNNGAGYDQSAFYQLVFRQVMYLLKYKSLNSQTALGRGYVDGNGGAINTGGTNIRGMDFGETTGKVQMKLFGLEDFWGNVYEWIDGLVTDSNRNLLIGTDNFNESGAGYTNYGQGSTSKLTSWMKRPQGTTEKGFIIKEDGASETTYFCDYATLLSSRVSAFGGNWNAASAAGVFQLHVWDAINSVFEVTASRLMYL